MNETATLLDALRDVHDLPNAVIDGGESLLSWFLIAACLLACVIGVAIRLLRRPTWRRQAETRLAEMRAGVDTRASADTLADASRLVRQLALVAVPRERVASLTGEAWLARLDTLAGASCFTAGPGRLVAEAPYRRDVEIAPDELLVLLDHVDRLVDAIAVRARRDRMRRSWLRVRLRRRDVSRA